MSVLTTTPLKTAPSAATGVVLTTGIAPTWGAWVQVIASTAAPVAIGGMQVSMSLGSKVYEVDIGVGAAAAEVSVGTLQLYSYLVGTTIGGPDGFLLPVPLGGIGAGVRVALRARVPSGSGTIRVALNYYENLSSDQVTTAAQVLTAAPVTAVVNLTLNTTPWANTAWVELLASAATDIGLLGLVHATNAVGNSVAGIEYDLGTGGSGAETVLTTLRDGGAFNAGFVPYTMLPGIYPVVAGTRLSLRARKAGTQAGSHPVALLYYTNVSALPPPTVETRPATVLTSEKARLHGRFHPGGAP